jgi:P-type Mg2+ transporter
VRPCGISVVLITPGNVEIEIRKIDEEGRPFGNVTKYLLMGLVPILGMCAASPRRHCFCLPADVAQILLNNLLYDLAQVTIPTDNVDPQLHSEAKACSRKPS